MRLIYLFEEEDKDMVKIHIKSLNMTYSIPKKIWELAIEKFNEKYKGSDAVKIAKEIARQLMPSNHEDPYREERLWRCLLSKKAKTKKRKIKQKKQNQKEFKFKS